MAVGVGESLVTVVRRRGRARASSGWDDFAISAETSFRGSSRHLMAWVAKRLPRYRLRRFEMNLLTASGPQKVGQCAVAVGRGGGVFLDQMQLLPTARDLWSDAMGGVLRQLPAGTYQYGWEQNVEPGRAAELAALPGVEVTGIRPIVVHAVEFANWPSWDAYEKALSSNTRRNVKKAITEFPDVHVVTESGAAGLRQIPTLLAFRSQMYERKGIDFKPVSAAASALMNSILGLDEFRAQAVSDDLPQASFTGVRFGSKTYYLDGASNPSARGMSWYLLVEMLREAYEKFPRGLFVMGYLDPAIHDESVSAGLLRSRSACRVSDLSTEIVTFTWAG